LHVLFMFIAFAMTTGVGIAASAVANTRDVRAIRAATKIAQPLQLAGAIFILVGVIFCFATAAAAGYNLGSTWLVVAFVCVGLLWIMGAAVHRTWLVRLANAAAASPDDRPSAEVDALLDDKLVQAAGPISGVIWIIAIAVMVMKP
jgi:protein-S-isoprenylcysteine O-methyltransferase Ste14